MRIRWKIVIYLNKKEHFLSVVNIFDYSLIFHWGKVSLFLLLEVLGKSLAILRKYNFSFYKCLNQVYIQGNICDFIGKRFLLFFYFLFIDKNLKDFLK